MVLKATNLIIENALKDNILTIDEEEKIVNLYELSKVSYEEFPPEAKQKLVKAAIIRDLLEEKKTSRLKVENLPFNLMKKETLIWVFENATLNELKTTSEWQSGNQGVSIRIAKGVYWRVGSSRGQTVRREYIQSSENGIFAVTNYHLFFKNYEKTIRIRIDKIISVSPTESSVVIHQDGVRSKPKEFVVDDPWFLSNIISNAKNWT